MSKKSKNGKGRVKVSVPVELVDAIEAAGESIEDVVERLLRAAVGKPTADSAKRRFAGFLQDIAGPHLPQLEAIAKDVASKVAKDVATAAAAAALTTFAAKAAGEAQPAKKAAAPKAAAKPAAKPRAAAKPAATSRKAPARKPGPKPAPKPAS